MTRSLLATDAYKFSMSAAGYPLRTETFTYSHRRGGPHFLPFDVEAEIRALLPDPDDRPTADPFLTRHGYDLGGGVWQALAGEVTVDALPAGSWFLDREPAFTVTGPSALISWLEPQVLMLHWRIQIATRALSDDPTLADDLAVVSTEAERAIALAVYEQIGKRPPEIAVDGEPAAASARERVASLIGILEDPRRLFEVGMRAARCLDHHHLILQAGKDAGLVATSNVLGAMQLGLKPVGTMGHEHVQRFGGDDDAFRAMRDRHPGATSYLLDTFSTTESGLPIAFGLIAEAPERRDTVRFDSGDLQTQLRYAVDLAKRMGIAPRFILEDGFTAERTRTFEALRRELDLPAEDVLYGYGSHIVTDPSDRMGRNRVAAVWKLSQSGPNPNMKFGDAGRGKRSIPGRPILVRRANGSRMVFQQGEPLDAGDVPLTGAPVLHLTPGEARRIAEATGSHPALSPATEALVDTLTKARSRAISEG